MLSVVNLQEAYAKALLVDRTDARPPASSTGDVLGGHEVLLDAYNTDVRPLCARVRAKPRAPPPTRSPSCARAYYVKRSGQRRAGLQPAGRKAST